MIKKIYFKKELVKNELAYLDFNTAKELLTNSANDNGIYKTLRYELYLNKKALKRTKGHFYRTEISSIPNEPISDEKIKKFVEQVNEQVTPRFFYRIINYRPIKQEIKKVNFDMFCLCCLPNEIKKLNNYLEQHDNCYAKLGIEVVNQKGEILASEELKEKYWSVNSLDTLHLGLKLTDD